MKNPETLLTANAEAYLAWMLAQPNQVDSPSSTSEAYTVFLSVDLAGYYYKTGDARFRDAATRQANKNLTYITAHDLPSYPWVTYYTRDAICRDIIHWYILYKLLGDINYLRTAERIANAFKGLTRVSHIYNSINYNLYYTLYNLSDKSPYGATTIDPNQDMEVALAFALLYSEPMSTVANGATYPFYQDATLLPIINDEANAAQALLQSDGGWWMEEDISNHINDTTYQEYATLLLIKLNQLLPNTTWGNNIVKSGQYSLTNHSTESTLYDSSSNTYAQGNNNYQLWWRTIIWYHAGLTKPAGWLGEVWGDHFFDANNLYKKHDGTAIASYWKHRALDSIYWSYFLGTDETYLYNSEIFGLGKQREYVYGAFVNNFKIGQSSLGEKKTVIEKYSLSKPVIGTQGTGNTKIFTINATNKGNVPLSLMFGESTGTDLYSIDNVNFNPEQKLILGVGEIKPIYWKITTPTSQLDSQTKQIKVKPINVRERG